MKKLIIIALTALIGWGATACSDFLERPPLGQENLDTYFQNEEECLKYIAGCYQALFYEDWWKTQRFVVQADMCTDDMWMGNTSQDASYFRDLAHYTGNGQTTATLDFWQYRYKGILNCNVAILRIPQSPVSNAKLKERLVAEAKFLRAYYYFDLIRNFGGVPIVLGLVMPSEAQGLGRSTLAESYDRVEKDLRDAIFALPLRSEYAPADMGRATKGAAQALLAKVYLYQEKYEEARKELYEVYESHEYDLLPDFGDVWSIEHNNSIESLFEVQTNADMTYSLGQRISVVCASRNDSGWAWGAPTSDLENAFIEAGDDVRLRWTIIRHNAESIPGDAAATVPYQIHPNDHKSARVSRKLYIPVAQRPDPFDGPHIPLNYRLLRYADVLLMYAEVENALGNDTDARKHLNKVRGRVGLDEVDASGKALRDAIRRERRLELALECNRLYDLRRWTDDNGLKAICNIMGPEGSFVRYNTETSTDEFETVNQRENSNKGIFFQENRDLLFPIPNNEVALSGGSIVQNPHYN